MSINTINNNSSNKLENILIIVNGGRENVLEWSIKKRKLIKKIYLAHQLPYYLFLLKIQNFKDKQKRNFQVWNLVKILN